MTKKYDASVKPRDFRQNKPSSLILRRMKYLFIVVFFWPKIEFSRVSKKPWGGKGLDFFWFELFYYF